MKALVCIGYEYYCFDVSAVPFLASAIKVKQVRDGYHPVDDSEGMEIRLIPDEKIRLTETEQQKDYKGEAEQYSKWWTQSSNENAKLTAKIKELTASIDALKSVCPHPAAPEKTEETPIAPASTEGPF